MNDFTKEELECLHNAIALQLRDIPMSETNAIRRSELVGKLQSMIDNYCEQHESDGFDYFKIAEDELLMDVLKSRKHQLKCKICGKLYNDNQ